jgi:hypothetical protein
MLGVSVAEDLEFEQQTGRDPGSVGGDKARAGNRWAEGRL